MGNRMTNPGFRLRTRGVLLFFTLVLASLACNLGTGARPDQEDTPVPIPITTESVEELKENLQAAATQASTSGVVTIEFDEAQLTSLVAFELDKQENPIFQDPQVYLRDGQVQLYGNAVQSGITLPVSIIATLSVDERGMPRYDILSATAGPVPLPQSILDQLTDQFDQAIASKLDAENSNLVVEDIVIADGKMTITGRTR